MSPWYVVEKIEWVFMLLTSQRILLGFSYTPQLQIHSIHKGDDFEVTGPLIYFLRKSA